MGGKGRALPANTGPSLLASSSTVSSGLALYPSAPQHCTPQGLRRGCSAQACTQQGGECRAARPGRQQQQQQQPVTRRQRAHLSSSETAARTCSATLPACATDRSALQRRGRGGRRGQGPQWWVGMAHSGRRPRLDSAERAARGAWELSSRTLALHMQQGDGAGAVRCVLKGSRREKGRARCLGGDQAHWAHTQEGPEGRYAPHTVGRVCQPRSKEGHNGHTGRAGARHSSWSPMGKTWGWLKGPGGSQTGCRWGEGGPCARSSAVAACGRRAGRAAPSRRGHRVQRLGAVTWCLTQWARGRCPPPPWGAATGRRASGRWI